MKTHQNPTSQYFPLWKKISTATLGKSNKHYPFFYFSMCPSLRSDLDASLDVNFMVFNFLFE